MFLRLPIFFMLLVFKNVTSWTKVIWSWLGFPIVLISLLALNILAGITLYLAYTQANQTKNNLEKAQEKLTRQQQFWKKLFEQFPTHKVIRDTNAVLSTQTNGK